MIVVEVEWFMGSVELLSDGKAESCSVVVWIGLCARSKRSLDKALDGGKGGERHCELAIIDGKTSFDEATGVNTEKVRKVSESCELSQAQPQPPSSALPVSGCMIS